MIPIERIDDPRITPYCNLRDRTLRGENIFLAEGVVVVERMLQSVYRPESLLVAEEHATAFASKKPDCPLYVATAELLRQIAGYNFHLGALAIGRRPAGTSIEVLLQSTLPTDIGDAESPVPQGAVAPCCVLVCPAVTKPENMGLLFRSAAAFGVSGIILGHACCDPLSRRCVRVSMGAVLEVPFARSHDPLVDLPALKQPWRFERIAAVLDPHAELLAKVRPAPRTALIFGNEYDGLASHWLAECDRRVTIPMSPAVDSLNLGVAAGIFIHHWAAAQRA